MLDDRLENKEDLINKIIRLATSHLHKEYTSSVIYDRGLLAVKSQSDLTDLLNFLLGFEPDPDIDQALKEAFQFKDLFPNFIEEHITISDVEPFDPTRRGFNP